MTEVTICPDGPETSPQQIKVNASTFPGRPSHTKTNDQLISEAAHDNIMGHRIRKFIKSFQKKNRLEQKPIDVEAILRKTRHKLVTNNPDLTTEQVDALMAKWAVVNTTKPFVNNKSPTAKDLLAPMRKQMRKNMARFRK
jgi:hypothetical protein